MLVGTPKVPPYLEAQHIPASPFGPPSRRCFMIGAEMTPVLGVLPPPATSPPLLSFFLTIYRMSATLVGPIDTEMKNAAPSLNC